MFGKRILQASMSAAIVAGVAAAFQVAATGAKAAGATSYEQPLTTVVFDFDPTGAPLLMRSDDSTGAGQATYTTTFRSGKTVALYSGIGSNGNWKLTLFNQSARTLWITPNQAVDGSQPAGPPAGYYWEGGEAYSQCFDQSGNIVPFQNLTRGSSNCSLGVDFSSNGVKYKLVMSPRLPSPGPATGLASVACNAVSDGRCVDWTIAPDTAAPNPTVANLYSWTGARKQPWAYVGQYHNTFRIKASYP